MLYCFTHLIYCGETMYKSKKSLALISLLASAPFCQADIAALVHNNQLEFSGLNDQLSYQLKLRLPNGELKDLTFDKSGAIQFDAADFAIAGFADGQYKYELLPVFSSQEKVTRNHKAPLNDAPVNQPEVLSGVFTVKSGSTVVDQDEQNRAQVIPQDLIVQGSECIGLDCVNGESFGFDTLRLKENNLRIRFMDTSTSASFPTNDWELTANETSNGGANKFSITDIDNNRVPFTVEAGARSHSLYVDNAGRVGFGTNNPVVEAHIADGDTPTVRLEQNGTNGWQPQTWDVAGNESNFFIRDVTNGSRLPFRIQPSAPSDSLYISNIGNIGLGDSSPDAALDINSGNLVLPDGRIGIGTEAPTNLLHLVNTTNTGITLENTTANIAWKFVNKNNLFSITKVGTSSSEFQVFDSGAMIVGAGGATPNFDMDASGNITIQGTLMQNSDINAKENITSISTSNILDKVMALPISVWNYKFDEDHVKHLGPMAQDFFAQFGLGHTDDKIATIDTSGVALASIQELGNRLKQKDSEIEALKTSNERLSQRLSKLEKLLSEKL